MPIPRSIAQNLPDGLQYLSTVNQLLVKQQVEIIEGKKYNNCICHLLFKSLDLVLNIEIIGFK